MTGERHYYHHDGLGSIVGLTNSAGSVAQSYIYDEFGNLLSSYGVVPNSYLYTGQEWDVAPCNFYNLRARMYEPRVGRFISEDPALQVGSFRGTCGSITLIRKPQRFNAYLYVANNSINWADPSGLGCTKEEIQNAILLYDRAW